MNILVSININTRPEILHRLIVLGLFAFAPTFASAAVPAFPGAQGGGAASVGGRGGRVIEVTNLNDSGPGSFRDAVSQTGARAVVFRVGGTITLQSQVLIREPYLTIAGQTAPGGGIQLRGDRITIVDPAHDVIVRYIRHRRGWSNTNGFEAKGFQIAGRSNAVYNVIVDHSSFGWQQDDNDAWQKLRNITFQWNIFAEGNNPEAFNGIGGKGLLIGAPPGLGHEMGSISIHHNYITSNFMRNPSIAGHGPTEVVNNVIYNWGPFGSLVQNRGGGTAVNFIGNYYKAGPDSSKSRYEVLVDGASPEQLPQMVYVRDNLSPHRTSSTQAEWAIVGYCKSGPTYCVVPASTSFQRSSPWPPSSAYPIAVSPAQANVANVLNNVGATRPARDAVDARLVAEYHAGTGNLGGNNAWPALAAGTPPADTDHDGMPDQWETSKGLKPNYAADRNDVAASGYTNLEVYLAGTGATTPPPPPDDDPPPPPSGDTIGETSILSVTDSNNGNKLVAQRATLSQTATIRSLSFYVVTASGFLRLGIYDATGPGGGPGAKKAETVSITPTTGWNTANVTPVSLPPGTYWLAYLANMNSLKFKGESTGGNSRLYSFTFGTMPPTFSTAPGSSVWRWSLYATLAP